MSTPTTSARIFLVRHGETDWITGGKFASRTDIPLSTMGERDVEFIRERLVDENEMIDPTGVAKMSVRRKKPFHSSCPQHIHTIHKETQTKREKHLIQSNTNKLSMIATAPHESTPAAQPKSSN